MVHGRDLTARYSIAGLMTCHTPSAGIVEFDVSIENVVPDHSAGDDRKNKVSVIRHEDQHEEERQEDGGAVQGSSQQTQMRRQHDPIRISAPPPIQQPHHLAGSAPVRRAPATVAYGACYSLPLPEFRGDASIDGLLEEAEVLVQDAEQKDCSEGKDKLSVGVNVPGGEDDTGVDDLGVPEHVHRTSGRHFVPFVVAVVHDEKTLVCRDKMVGVCRCGSVTT